MDTNLQELINQQKNINQQINEIINKYREDIFIDEVKEPYYAVYIDLQKILNKYFHKEPIFILQCINNVKELLNSDIFNQYQGLDDFFIKWKILNNYLKASISLRKNQDFFIETLFLQPFDITKWEELNLLMKRGCEEDLKTMTYKFMKHSIKQIRDKQIKDINKIDYSDFNDNTLYENIKSLVFK